MKTNQPTEKNLPLSEEGFKTVTFFRNVKEQIAKELEGKSFEEQKKLLREFLLGERKLKTTE